MFLPTQRKCGSGAHESPDIESVWICKINESIQNKCNKPPWSVWVGQHVNKYEFCEYPNKWSLEAKVTS